jgi:hypothetical protein
MATAGYQARILAGALSGRRNSGRDPDGLAQDVLQRYVEVLEYPWTTVALGDFQLEQTTGDRPAGLDASARFSSALA